MQTMGIANLASELHSLNLTDLELECIQNKNGTLLLAPNYYILFDKDRTQSGRRTKANRYEGECSKCGKRIIYSDAEHDGIMECPHCNQICVQKAITGGRSKITVIAQAINQDILLLRYCARVKEFSLQSKKWYGFRYEEFARFYLYKNKSVFYKNESKYGMGNYLIKHTAFEKKELRAASMFDVIIQSLEEECSKTFFSKYNINKMSELVSIDALDLHRIKKYPVINRLFKEEFNYLFTEALSSKINDKNFNINFSAKNKKDTFGGLDISIIKKYNIALLSSKDIGVLQLWAKRKETAFLTAEELKSLSYVQKDTLEKLFAMPVPIKKMLTYLLKQKQSISYYYDYMELCIKMQLTLTEQIKFPKNLNSAHDIMVKFAADTTIEDKNVDFFKAVAKWNGFEVETENLVCRSVGSLKELKQEGDELCHCVYTNYTSRITEGKTNIFLIRKKSEPDKPFFTLEISNDFKIIQNKTLLILPDGSKDTNSNTCGDAELDAEVKNIAEKAAKTAAKYKCKKILQSADNIKLLKKVEETAIKIQKELESVA